METVLLSLVFNAGLRSAVHVPAGQAVKMTCVHPDSADEVALAASARTAFSLLDLNGDGAVSESEFSRYMVEYKYTASATEKIFAELDTDSNGELSIDELVRDYIKLTSCVITSSSHHTRKLLHSRTHCTYLIHTGRRPHRSLPLRKLRAGVWCAELARESARRGG
jgi:hypothetical protein